METAEYATTMSDGGGPGSMDILVMLEENPEHSPVLAHVNSVPSSLDVERPSRDIVTIYGEPSAESGALRGFKRRPGIVSPS